MERIVRPARRLHGTVRVPGDKSISHRAAMLNALADGDAVVENFLPGADCLSTLAVLRALGATCTLDNDTLRVSGGGLRGLHEPPDVLECGNSGTTMRLMAGILAGQPFHSVLTGDASLRARPMRRIVTPLREMGAAIDGRADGEYAPLSLRGGTLNGIHYRPSMASAQVKSAVLLAGLYAAGETVVEEPAQSRDHTERMLAAMGAAITRDGAAVRVARAGRLEPLSMRVPNDISAAAFWMVAASIHPDAELRLPGVGVNPTRTGIIDALREMGGDVAVEEERTVGGEPVADIVVRSARLRGVDIRGEMIPRLLDEIPAIAVAAAFAEGTTTIRDARELAVKESDRIASTVGELKKMGARVDAREDGMVIDGGRALSGASVQSHGDHRLAMALAIAALASGGDTHIDDADAVGVSYPLFWADMEELSA